MDLARAILAIREANGLTQSNVRDTLRDALADAFPQPEDGGYSPSPWLMDIVGDDTQGFVVYSLGGVLYSCPYVITQAGSERSTTLSVSQAAPVMVRTVYDTDAGTTLEGAKVKPVNTKESELNESTELDGSIEDALSEAKAGGNYGVRIKVIQAGKGSSAFYPKEVLQRDGPTTFPAGTKMYWNHPTAAEEASRPEGNLDHLAAVTTSAATWDESGPKGPGLYADADVYPDFADRVKAKGKDIGVSIRAYGEGKQEKATGFTLQKFTRGASIDFVTLPGAGGAVLTEAARVANPTNGENDMTEAQVQALIETQLAPLAATVETQRATIETQGVTIAAQRTALVLESAKNIVAAAMVTALLPAPSKIRVAEAVLRQTIAVDAAGALDIPKLTEAIAAAVKSEGEYLTSLGGAVVTGMGASSAAGTVTEADQVASQANVVSIAREATQRVTNSDQGKKFAEAYAAGR